MKESKNYKIIGKKSKVYKVIGITPNGEKYILGYTSSPSAFAKHSDWSNKKQRKKGYKLEFISNYPEKLSKSKAKFIE